MDIPSPVQDAAASQRLAELSRYAILDTPPEPGFDDLVLLATRVCDTPVALVSLVTQDRQWFKARIGFPACETPLGQSVCAHALRQDGVMVIPDMTVDERTRDNPLVTGDPFIRFYAGAVLQGSAGVPFGTLCVIDTVTRPDGLTATQVESLAALARQVVSQMELRRAAREHTESLERFASLDAAFRAHQQMLQDERLHRLKNVLTIVQAIVSQSLRHSDNVKDARSAISSRLDALAKAQDLLFSADGDCGRLRSIVANTVQIYQSDTNRFHIAGPDLEIGSRATLGLSLILHELATNATKYGALSAPGGSVAITWSQAEAEEEPTLSFAWREQGGPVVTAPARVGFGTSLIEHALAGGTAKLDYPPDGASYRLLIPIQRLSDT